MLFNNFSQADPDFQEMNMAELSIWRSTIFFIKGTSVLLRTLRWSHCKVHITQYTGKPIWGARFQQISGFKGIKSMLMAQGEENIKMNSVFPDNKPFCALVATYVKTRTSLLGANRSLLELSGKEVFCPQSSLGDILLVTHDPPPPQYWSVLCANNIA